MATVADKYKNEWAYSKDDEDSFSNGSIADLLGLFSGRDSDMSEEEKAAMQEAVRSFVLSNNQIRRLLVVNTAGEPIESASDEEIQYADSLTYQLLIRQGRRRTDLKKPALAEKETLNPGETAAFYNLSRRKFFRLLESGEKFPFLAFYKERKLIIRSKFEKYMELYPEMKERLKNGRAPVPQKA